MAGVFRSLGQAADYCDHLFPAHPPGFIDGLSLNQLRDCRPAGHGRNAAFRTKANLADALPFQSNREFKNVAAGRIFQASHRIRSLHFAGVARVPKVVEEFGGIHTAIVLPEARVPVAYNRAMPHSHSPQRIACLQPSATVILAAVGELDRVVACTKYCQDVVPELRTDVRSGTHRISIIADSWTSKTGEILAAKPDLVIAAVPYQEAAVSEILKAGIRFLGLAPRTLSDIYTDIALISASVGAAERGERVIAEMQAAIEDVRQQMAPLPPSRVFCEEWGKPIIASQPWVAELVSAAGGEFIGKPGTQCSAEEVAHQDPDVLLAAWCGAGDRVPLQKIVTERGWTNTTAARNGQVYCISDELLNTPAPTLIAGLHALAGAIHPEISGPQRGLRSITQVLQPQVRR